MLKTSKITFNVNDLQREHTGQKRRYDNIGLTARYDGAYSPATSAFSF